MIEWLDAGTIELFQPLHNPVLTVIMKFFTTIGEGGAVWILAAVLLLLFKKTRKAGIILAGALILCLLSCNIALKNLVARPRPCWRREDLEMLIAIPKDFSFPSGHTTASFAGGGLYFFLGPQMGNRGLCDSGTDCSIQTVLFRTLCYRCAGWNGAWHLYGMDIH